MLAIIAAVTTAAPVPKAKTPIIEVSPFATTIRADDPAELLLTFRNNTGADIATKGPGIGSDSKKLCQNR